MAACGLLWSTTGLLIKLVDWHPFAIAAARSAIPAIFLLAVVRRPRFKFSFDKTIGAVFMAATVILFVFANKHTTAANAILLQYAAPIYVAILGAATLKEKPRMEHWLALAAICLGMFLFFKESLGKGDLLGDLMAALSGVTFALQIVVLRKQKDDSPFDSLLLGHIFIALIAGLISLFLPAPIVTARTLLLIVPVSIAQVGLATILFAYAIKRITALESILTAVIEPLFSPLWVFLFLGELPGKTALLGGVLIISAVVTSSIISALRSAKARR